MPTSVASNSQRKRQPVLEEASSFVIEVQDPTTPTLLSYTRGSHSLMWYPRSIDVQLGIWHDSLRARADLER